MNHFENPEGAARIRRITEMENSLNRIGTALKIAELCPAVLDAVREDVRALSAYFEGPLWREDFEADEAGSLPQELKRGVLSEDALYDLLTEYDALKVQMQEAEKKLE